MNALQRVIKFKDAAGNVAKVEAGITFRNGYAEFTACGEYGGGMGQCLDRIQPKNDAQRKLIELWKQYHLNGMNAGTPKQTKAIQEWLRESGEAYDINKAVVFLKSKRLYTDKHPKTGKPYQYGSGWIVKDLPEDLDQILNSLCDEILEEERKDKIKDRDLAEAFEKHPKIILAIFEEKFSSDAKKALALGLNEELTVREALEEITVNGNVVSYGGGEWLIGDDDEMESEHDDYLENYIDECIIFEIPKPYQCYFDREAWKKDARYDGRGHSLNRYDGGEDMQEVGGETIYIYRQ